MKTKIISISDVIELAGAGDYTFEVPLPRSQNYYRVTFFSFVSNVATLSTVALYVVRGTTEYPLCIFTELSGKRSGQLYFEGYVIPDASLLIIVSTTGSCSLTYTIQGQQLIES